MRSLAEGRRCLIVYNEYGQSTRTLRLVAFTVKYRSGVTGLNPPGGALGFKRGREPMCQQRALSPRPKGGARRAFFGRGPRSGTISCAP